MPRLFPRRPLWRALLAAATMIVALAIAGVVVVLVHQPGNVSHPNVEFTVPTTTAAPKPSRPHKHARHDPKRPPPDNFQWPTYGYRQTRVRDFDPPVDLEPPFNRGWTYRSGALLEFPPVIYHTTMFFLDDGGYMHALDMRTGKLLWQRQLGTLAAASPVVAGHQGEVLAPTLSTTGHSPGDGEFYAMSMKTGKVIWRRPVGAGSESSPIVSGRTVYFGDSAGNLYARDVINGHLDWVYHASGAIKGGAALSHGILYFGDYAGRAYAVRASDGHQVWAVSTDGARYGFGSGQFYTTPAVAFGRVYMGNTDGFVYSFGAAKGTLAWKTHTGGYVYGSAAVADPKGVGPTVYVGSYDEHFYAFNARSGAIRWSHYAGGRISGSASVIGDIVYYSNLGDKTTVGLDDATGKQVFSFPDGAFTPALADYHAVYLVGYGNIYQLLPHHVMPYPGAANSASTRPHNAKSKPKPKPSAKARPKPSAKRRSRHRARSHHAPTRHRAGARHHAGSGHSKARPQARSQHHSKPRHDAAHRHNRTRRHSSGHGRTGESQHNRHK